MNYNQDFKELQQRIEQIQISQNSLHSKQQAFIKKTRNNSFNEKIWNRRQNFSMLPQKSGSNYQNIREKSPLFQQAKSKSPINKKNFIELNKQSISIKSQSNISSIEENKNINFIIGALQCNIKISPISQTRRSNYLGIKNQQITQFDFQNNPNSQKILSQPQQAFKEMISQQKTHVKENIPLEKTPINLNVSQQKSPIKQNISQQKSFTNQNIPLQKMPIKLNVSQKNAPIKEIQNILNKWPIVQEKQLQINQSLSLRDHLKTQNSQQYYNEIFDIQQSQKNFDLIEQRPLQTVYQKNLSQQQLQLIDQNNKGKIEGQNNKQIYFQTKNQDQNQAQKDSCSYNKPQCQFLDKKSRLEFNNQKINLKLEQIKSKELQIQYDVQYLKKEQSQPQEELDDLTNYLLDR